MYAHTIRPFLFHLDPERLHGWTIAQARLFALNPFLQRLLAGLAAPVDPRLSQTIWGLNFNHPVGLAAGFDKNAEAIATWPCIGFAFAEVGTITAQPQAGNPSPRLFRLRADEAIVNRYGFNNQGAEAVAQRLFSDPQAPPGFPVGINLGKSKVTPLEEAASDYLWSFQQLYPYGDYFVVNVSSPNTPGLRLLQSQENLAGIISGLREHNRDGKPILVKIAPDLAWSQLDEVLQFATDFNVDGIIATNTTLQRDGLTTQTIPQTGRPPTEEAGGLSGPPLRSKSTAIVRYIYRHTQGQLPIIGVGGIDSVEAAWEKIAAGASLVQLYTGLVYQGPGLTARIARGLVAKLDESGFNTIAEAVGCNCN